MEVAAQMAAAAVGTGGARGVKRIESLVEELGVKPPQVSTRAVCEAWLELRKEATELLELRKQLAKRQEELTGTTAACVEAAAPAPAGARRGAVFQRRGVCRTRPRAKRTRCPSGPDGQPIGIRPAKREQKRKMPASSRTTTPPSAAAAVRGEGPERDASGEDARRRRRRARARLAVVTRDAK